MLQDALARLTTHVSSLSKAAAVVAESIRGAVMSVHYERRFGFLVAVHDAGDIMATLLVDPALPDEPVYCDTPQRTLSFPRRSFVSERYGWQAVEHFALTGERSPDAHWHVP